MRIGLAMMLGLLIFGGCAGSPQAILHSSGAELAAVDNRSLCQAYAFGVTWNSDVSNLRTEINRRGLISADEWKIVDDRDIKPGMRENALIASRGLPIRATWTETQGHVTKQWEMEALPATSGRSVYVVLDNWSVVSVTH